MRAFYLGRPAGSCLAPSNLSHLTFQIGKDYYHFLRSCYCKTWKMLSCFFKVLAWNHGKFGLHATFMLLSPLQETPQLQTYVITCRIVAWEKLWGKCAWMSTQKVTSILDTRSLRECPIQASSQRELWIHLMFHVEQSLLFAVERSSTDQPSEKNRHTTKYARSVDRSTNDK